MDVGEGVARVEGLEGGGQRQLHILNNTCLVLMEVSSGAGLISQRLQPGPQLP